MKVALEASVSSLDVRNQSHPSDKAAGRWEPVPTSQLFPSGQKKSDAMNSGEAERVTVQNDSESSDVLV